MNVIINEIIVIHVITEMVIKLMRRIALIELKSISMRNYGKLRGMFKIHFRHPDVTILPNITMETICVCSPSVRQIVSKTDLLLCSYD